MAKIKFKKDVGVYKKGETKEMIDPRAEQYVSGGFAEYVGDIKKTEQNKPVPKAPIKKEEIKDD